MNAVRWWKKGSERMWRYGALTAGLSMSVIAAGCGGEDDGGGGGGGGTVSSADLECAAGKVAGEFCEAAEVQTLSLDDISGESQASNFATGSGVAASHTVTEYVFRYKMLSNAGGEEADIDATGVVLIPDGDAPASGYPIIVWNHGAIGIADDCAVSRDSEAALEQTARLMAARGAIVFAPDYAGLGVDDVPHYFLVKEPTAYSILDGIKATIEFAEGEGVAVDTSKVGMVGLSQGGQASLFAQEVYAEGAYDADFTLVGVVSNAPAPAWKYALWLATVYGSDADDSGTVSDEEGLPASLTAFAASYVWAAQQYNPDLDLADVLQADQIDIINEYADTDCTGDLSTRGFSNVTAEFASSQLQSVSAFSLLGSELATFIGSEGEAGSTTAGGFLAYFGGTHPVTAAAVTPTYNLGGFDAALTPLTGTGWETQMAADSPGHVASTVPLRLTQGDLDDTVASFFTFLLSDEMYSGGSMDLEDASGTALGGAGGVPNFGVPSADITDPACTAGQILICDVGHSGDSGVLYSFENWAPWLFSKLGIEE